jgi:L-asparaginase
MGGTIEYIDPSYDTINRELLKLDTSIESYLENIIKPHFNFTSEIVAEKDSRTLDQADKENLINSIKVTKSHNILVTIGTYKMREMLELLDEQDFGEKKIILTGSMIPIVGFSASDAGFNLGFAIASFANLENGVYICMNGGIFHASEVKKNTKILRFE